MTNPSDGRVTSLTAFTGTLGGGDLFAVVSPGSATQGVNYKVPATTVAAGILPVLPAQSANTVLSGPTSGTAATPAFRALVTADLPVASVPKGGTNTTTLTQNGVLFGNGTSTIGLTGQGGTTQFLSGNSTSAPAFRALATGDMPVGVLTNVRLAETANYTVAAADSGSTIALGGNAFFTLTFNAASGYGANFIVVVTNEDATGTGRGKTIHSAAGDFSDFILYPGLSVTVFNDSNTWKVSPPNQLWFITPGKTVTFYVDPVNGLDTNDGLASGAGNAFLTIQHAVDTVANNLFFQSTYNGLTGTSGKAVVQLANGNYAEFVLLKPIQGNINREASVAKILGDTTTPTNVVFKGASAGTVVRVITTNQPWLLTGVSFAPTLSSDVCIGLDWLARLDLGTITVSSAVADVIQARYGSYTEILRGSTVTVAANINTFANVTQGNATILAQGGGVITGILTGSISIGNVFVNIADPTCIVDLAAITWTGSITGTKWLSRGGLFGGTTPNNLPGTVNGSFIGQFQNGNNGGILYLLDPSAAGNATGLNPVFSSPTLTQYGVVYGGGTAASPGVSAAGTTGWAFVGNGTAVAPSFQQIGSSAIATNTVVNANLAQMPASTIKANNTNATANVADITIAQLRTMLEQGDTLLSVVNTTNVTTLLDTASFTTGFDDYTIFIDNLVPTTTAGVVFQVVSGGVTQTATYLNATGTATTFFDVMGGSANNLGTTNGAGLSARLNVPNVNTSTVSKMLRCLGTYFNASGTAASVNGIGFWNGGLGVVSGFQISLTSGTMSSIIVRVFGHRAAL